ncbi:MAG: murein L,D-transpeptidase [Polyangiaceae bacterium]|nr:murein L,D-transpeptidase [Polyangiaceae bacterium]
MLHARTILGAVLIAMVTIPVVIVASSGQAETESPSSPRAKAAARNARDRLEKTLSKRNLSFGDEVFVRIFKEEAELELWMRADDEETFQLFKTYPVCAMSGALGPKEKEGDGQAPEGFYFVGPQALNPQSKYHLSFNIGYPNAYDRSLGRTGKLIMVHGDCVSIGCFAMTDERIEEIYSLGEAALSNGQKFFRVHVFPFRMTKKNMKRHARSPWSTFWANLKDGYDWFETRHVPPDVSVDDGKYVFDR